MTVDSKFTSLVLPPVTLLLILVSTVRLGGSQTVMPSPLGCKFIKQNTTTECLNTTLDNVLHALNILNRFIGASYKPRSIVIEDCEIPYLPYVFPKFNESLERIKLVQSQLEYVYPDAFAHLQNKLLYLDLSHNKLHSVPYAFSTLHSLEILNLQYNQIVFIWPGPQFRWMFNLREFNLAYNQIGFSSDYVPDVRKLTIQEPVSDHLYQLAQNLTLEEFNIEPVTNSLEIFNLSGNNLARLPTQLYRRRLPILKILDLSNNFISELPKLTAQMLPELRRLSLRSNLIETLDLNSLPTNLQELNFSENPLRCDCDVFWLHEWANRSNTVIRLPTCSSPPSVKGQFLLQLTNETLCEDHNETMKVDYTSDKFDDFELLSLSSTQNSITVSWKVKTMDKDQDKWKVLFRTSNDNPHKMTLNPGQQNISYAAKDSLKLRTEATYVTYVSKINNLAPNTTYVLCISFARNGRFLIQPEKCQAIKTVSHITTSTVRVETSEDVKEIRAKSDTFRIKTILTQMNIKPKSITLTLNVVTASRTERFVMQNNSLNDSPNSVKWVIRVRKFASFNITETEISVDINEAQSNRSFEYTVTDLSPSTGYDFCVQAINSKLVDETEKYFPDIVSPLVLQSLHKENMISISTSCKEIVTPKEKIFPVTEVAIATTVSTSTSAVVVAVVFFCCPKSIFKCKTKKLKEKFVRKTSLDDTVSQERKNNKSLKKFLTKNEQAPSRHLCLEEETETERNNSLNLLRDRFASLEIDETFLRQQANSQSFNSQPTPSDTSGRSLIPGLLGATSIYERPKTPNEDRVHYLTPKMLQETPTSYITLKHSEYSEGYSTSKNESMRSSSVYINPEEIQYIGGQKVQILVHGSETLPRNSRTSATKDPFPFHSRYSLPRAYWSKGGTTRHPSSSSESELQGTKSLNSIAKGKLWFHSNSLSDSTSGMSSHCSQLSSQDSISSSISFSDDVFIDFRKHFDDPTTSRADFGPKISTNQLYCIEHV
ncbi:uncharacterized protein LOC143228969 isoform X2 [Tachypleus tridentatus]